MSRPVRALSRSEKMRLLGGLVVRPFVAGGIAFVTFPLLLLDRHGQTLAGAYPVDVTDAAVSVALGVGIVAGLVTVVGVLPVAVWLLKRRDLALEEALGVGVGVGNLLCVLLGVAADGTYGTAGLLRGIVFSSLQPTSRGSVGIESPFAAERRCARRHLMRATCSTNTVVQRQGESSWTAS